MTTRDFVVGEPVAAGATVSVRVEVPADLRTLEGHFPGNPVVPGVAQVLLVERAARVAWAELPRARGLERLKFRRRIDPGDVVDVRLTRDGEVVRFVVSRGDDECTRGTLRFA